MTAGAAGRDGFLWRHFAPALAVLFVLLLMDGTAIDSIVSGWFFDPVSHTFPLRYNSSLEIIGHQGVKQLVTVMACCVITLYLLSFVLPDLRPRRRLLLFVALGMTLSPLAVVALRAESALNCPWNLQEYGGFAPHVRLLDVPGPGFALGHCFPSGHASAGFCLFAFYFAGLEAGNARLARAGLWGGLIAGVSLGMVRIAQGAHFLSHNLWAGLVCWLVILALYIAMMRMPASAPALRQQAGCQ